MDFSGVENFGAIDADADELLRDCFQDHPAYIAAKRHQRFLIIGRKGSGKTAIYKKLITDRSPELFSYGHTFEDYPWHHHDLQAQIGVPEERRYLHSWKYLILMSLAKVLLNWDQSQPWSDESLESLGGLEAFVVDSYGSRDPDLTQLFSPEKELRFKGSLKLPFAQVDGERVRVRDLPTHVQEVNREVTRHVVESLNPESDYYVCFDQLDLGFTAVDPLYSQRLIGLLLAARELSQSAQDSGKRLSIVVFLRDDIYQSLQFEDKNKITENHLSRIEWNTYGPGLTLKRLMESRFGQTLERVGSLGWDQVFDEAKSMPSRQTKYAHICDRTFLRPRDMIKFCNEVLLAYRTRKTSGSGQFDNKSIIDARDAYSDYLLNELEDEIHKHVPEYREYLEAIKSIGSLQFNAEQFELAWKERRPQSAKDSTAALQELFDFSVIGFLKSGGGGGGSKYSWKYRDPRARFNEGAEWFRVHPGFKDALDLTRGKSAQQS